MSDTWYPGDPWTLPIPDPGVVMAEWANALRALATEVDVVVDDVLTSAKSPHWVCPNADDVRGQLGVHQRAAHTAADDLREEARSLDSQATRIRQTTASEYARSATSTKGH